MLTGPGIYFPLIPAHAPSPSVQNHPVSLGGWGIGPHDASSGGAPRPGSPRLFCRKMHIRRHVEGGRIRGMNTSASKPPGRPQGGVRTPSASRRAPGGIDGRPEPFARRADGWTKPEVAAGFDAIGLWISAAVKGPLGDGETHMKQDSLDKRNGLLQENRLTHFIRVAGSHPVDIPGPVRLSWRSSR